ncbi:MAG: branched-chain amino acid ABC transporter permease, partial [Acidibrevibacterium sp.]|uniref:branched-chain amino acid ABC transporter permease n=1 Tax=Acidibrevibacterium sp. TaxID=2606776 RepID=UPI003D088200
MAGLGLAAVLALSAVWFDDYQALILGEVGIVVIIGVGLNVLIGLAGQISIGQVAFQAIGAYAVALVTARAPSLFWPALALGVALAALCGFLLALPAMRLKGPYLAMITIAFAFVVEHGIIVGKALTGGANGIALGAGVPLPWGDAQAQAQAALIVLVAAASVLAYAVLARSRLGLALAAVRDSETAANAIGLNPVALKCVAFAIAAGLAGLAGG